MFIKFNDINYINNLTIFIYLQTKKNNKKNKGTKEKKSHFSEDGYQIKSPTITSGVAATLGKGINHKAPILLSSMSTCDANDDQVNNASASLQLDKLCRIFYNDGSSTMIIVKPGETCYQVLNKIIAKKNIPWFKCDIYFVGDYQVILFINSNTYQ